MNRPRGLTLFSVRGVAVNIHISLLFLLLYVILIASIQFPEVARSAGIDPFLIRGSPVFWALLFSPSLIASVLLHEFGHVWVAQAYGAKVRRITLMMLGGVSEMEGSLEDPRKEWKVALVGPLVSLAIAGLLFAFRMNSESLEIRFFTYWVGQLNLVIAIFNLVPAFPMDGGRILRSFLVARRGRLRGTKNAVSVSHVFAWILGLMGLLQFNIILILIALFLYGASQGELLLVVGENLLKDMRVSEAMTIVPAIDSEQPLSEAARRMIESKMTVLPVQSLGGPSGVIGIDALKRIPKDRWASMRIKELDTTAPEAVRSDDNIGDILEKGLSSEATPVIESGRITGLVRATQLADLIRLKSALSSN